MTSVTRLPAAVVDTSAIFCIFEKEASGPAFLDAMERCERLFLSAGTLAELSILMIARAGSEGASTLDDFIATYGIEVIPVDARSVRTHFRDGFFRYGKGTGHPARLNYGDLFAYALATDLNLPLLFQGGDFSRTEIGNAMSALGFALGAKGETKP